MRESITVAGDHGLHNGDVISWEQRRPRWQRWLSFVWRPWRSDRTVYKRIIDVESGSAFRIGASPKA